jgi:hypothetical protein
MKKIFAILLALSLVLGLPGAAVAKQHHKHHKHHKTTVLKGKFKAVGADGAYSNKKFGKAQLVDNKKRDKLSVHLRRLAPKTVYTFALYSVPKGTPRCREDASGGTQETAFPPKSKPTNKRGNLNAKQKSKTFKYDPKKRYFVLVYDGDEVVACAKLDRKGHRGHGKKNGHKGHKHKGHHKPTGAHKPKRAGKREEGKGQGEAKGHRKAKGHDKPKVRAKP